MSDHEHKFTNPVIANVEECIGLLTDHETRCQAQRIQVGRGDWEVLVPEFTGPPASDGRCPEQQASTMEHCALNSGHPQMWCITQNGTQFGPGDYSRTEPASEIARLQIGYSDECDVCRDTRMFLNGNCLTVHVGESERGFRERIEAALAPGGDSDE